MRFLKLKRFWFGLLGLLIVILLTSCSGTRMLMMTAPTTVKGKAAEPALAYTDLNAWKAARGDIMTRLQDEVYGQIPIATSVVKRNHEVLLERTFGATAQIEEMVVTFTPDYRDADNNTAQGPPQHFRMVLIVPRKADSTVPVIMTQNFCPNHNVVGKEAVSKPARETIDCGGDGVMSKLMHYFFGRYIVSPPIEDIMQRGYAVAVVHPPEWVPDRSASALTKLKTDMPRSYAIGSWASQFDAMAEVLDQDGRFSHQIAYGHSRYGKSALVAAAFSPRIQGVIAHQSGTGGASLSKDKAGESVAQITESYPHWFSPTYQDEALTIDQHHLLALIAPKPVLLGNAKRDVWSDPEGAFRAGKAATPIYNLYGSDGLAQSRLDAFDPSADIAFWMRPGTHGVVKEDWPAFLDFLDAHFKD